MRFVILLLTVVISQIFLYCDLYPWTTASCSASLLISADMRRLMVKMRNAEQNGNTSASETEQNLSTTQMTIGCLIPNSAHRHVVIGPNKDINKLLQKAIVLPGTRISML